MTATSPTPEAEQKLQALAVRRRAAIRSAFTGLHPLALGCGAGVVGGLAVGAATITLRIQGGKLIGDNLKSLSSYFPGYSVDAVGALVGALYGFAACFLLGWAIAAFRNLALRMVLGYARWAAGRWHRRHMLDEI